MRAAFAVGTLGGWSRRSRVAVRGVGDRAFRAGASFGKRPDERHAARAWRRTQATSRCRTSGLPGGRFRRGDTASAMAVARERERYRPLAPHLRDRALGAAERGQWTGYVLAEHQRGRHVPGAVVTARATRATASPLGAPDRGAFGLLSRGSA